MKTPDNVLPTYEAKQFTWHNGVGTADASDLGIPPGRQSWKRVWNDSVDQGFWVRGRTKTVLFTGSPYPIRSDVSEEFRWDFVSEDGFRITIYND